MGCGQSSAVEKSAVTEAPVAAPRELSPAELAKIEQEKLKQEIMGESAEPLPDFVPHPAFVIKSKRTNTFQKAFINVGYHESVPATARFITRDEQWKVDKKGENCVVFTAVIPKSVFDDMAKDPYLPSKVCEKIINLLNALYPMAKLDLEYTLPKIKSNFMGDEVDLITSDPDSARAFAAKKEERLAAAAAVAAAAAASSAPAPAAASTFSLFGSGSSAPAHGAVVNPHVTLQRSLEEEKANMVHVPPKMQGWLKKKGHIVVNWKTRYFVLDSGYLTYYVDQLDEPPYGKDRKGQICLAGYRIVHSGTKGTSTMGDEAAPEYQYRIQLMLMDNSFQERAGKSEYEEMMIEAASLEEKLAWLAALNAHTNYVENSLRIAMRVEAQASKDPATTAAPITATNDPKPWMVYLHPAQNETVVLCGVVNKPNPLGKQMIRELILTSQKRLIYVDSATLEEKGSIEWKSQNGVEPFVKIINPTTFEIHQPGESKVYKFITRDDLTAQHWVDAINSVKL